MNPPVSKLIEMELACTATQGGLTEIQFVAVTSHISSRVISHGISALHNGGCIGGDEDIAKITHSFIPRIDIHLHLGNTPHKWSKWVMEHAAVTYESVPNLVRNRNMVDVGDEVIACPGEDAEILRSGTWATIRYARDKAKKPLWIFYPSGGYEVWN